MVEAPDPIDGPGSRGLAHQCCSVDVDEGGSVEVDGRQRYRIQKPFVPPIPLPAQRIQRLDPLRSTALGTVSRRALAHPRATDRVHRADREPGQLEALVHLKPVIAPRLVLLDVTIPDVLVATLHGALPAGWDDVPDSGAARSVGDSWLQRGSSLALEVPSVHSSSETNMLINPAHPDFAQLVIGNPVQFAFDRRLVHPYLR